MELPPGHLLSNDMELITSSDLASIRHSTNASPVSLRAAAEAILKYLPSLQPSHESDYGRGTTPTPHQTWIRKRKPAKHVSTGFPKLASKFHRRCLDTYNHYQTGNSDHLKKRQKDRQYLERLGLSVVISTADRRMRMQHDMLHTELMRALIWLLPKASSSDFIVLRSRKTFPREIYHRSPRLCGQVQKSLDSFSTRVEDERLQELSQCIDEGA